MDANALAQLLPLLAIVAIFWLLVVRPARRRQSALTALQSTLQPGSEVMLNSGIFGTVESVEADVIRLAVSDAATLRVHRQAVAQVVGPAEGAATAPDDVPPGASPGPGIQ